MNYPGYRSNITRSADVDRSDTNSKDSCELVGNNNELFSDLVLGVSQCPKCSGDLVTRSLQRDTRFEVHHCNRNCGIEVDCNTERPCVLNRMVQSRLSPCSNGHQDCWQFIRRSGRVITITCAHLGAGHNQYCGRTRKLWKGRKPIISEGAGKYVTKIAVLRSMYEEEVSIVNDIAEVAKLPTLVVRACLRRNALKALPHVKRLPDSKRVYDPRCDRYVDCYVLTGPGKRWITHILETEINQDDSKQ